jgi:hypothetical protein
MRLTNKEIVYWLYMKILISLKPVNFILFNTRLYTSSWTSIALIQFIKHALRCTLSEWASIIRAIGSGANEDCSRHFAERSQILFLKPFALSARMVSVPSSYFSVLVILLVSENQILRLKSRASVLPLRRFLNLQVGAPLS